MRDTATVTAEILARPSGCRHHPPGKHRLGLLPHMMSALPCSNLGNGSIVMSGLCYLIMNLYDVPPKRPLAQRMLWPSPT